MPHAPSNPGLAGHLVAPPAPLHDAEAHWRFGFLLVPGFSCIAFASAIEPLRTDLDSAIENLPALTALFLCGPNPINFPNERRLIHWLRRLAGRGIALGGIDTGSWLLARAGLLDGYRCTIHWQDLPSLTADFPRIIASEQVFEIDRQRYTCSGGTAAMDMMLQFIAETCGDGTTGPAAADPLIHERVRDRNDPQRIPLRHRIGTGQDRLSGAMALMEANVEEPMPCAGIAGYTGVSERQLERLFETRLATTPTAFYMGVRLARAAAAAAYDGQRDRDRALQRFPQPRAFLPAVSRLFRRVATRRPEGAGPGDAITAGVQ